MRLPSSVEPTAPKLSSAFTKRSVVRVAVLLVGLFTRRRSIEVGFREVRAQLGFETTRQWVIASVL